MEIKNNLISFHNLNIISEIKNLHQKFFSTILSYKKIGNLISRPNCKTGKFFNLISTNQIELNNLEIIEFYELVDQYCQERASSKINNCQIFLPVLEIPQFWSSPTFIIKIPNVVTYSGIYKYNLTIDIEKHLDMFDITKGCCKLLEKICSNRLEYYNIAIFERANNKDLEIKIHILNVLISEPAKKIFLTKIYDCIIEEIKTEINGDLYNEIYNEIFVSCSNSKINRWNLKKIITFTKSKKNKLLHNDEHITQFLANKNPVSLCFSINYDENCKLVKQKMFSDFDNDKISKIDYETAKIQLLSYNLDARYFWIMINNLPKEYYENREYWEELIRTFKHRKDCTILFKEFSDSTQYFMDFESIWNTPKFSTITHGYYHQLFKNNEKYQIEMSELYKNTLETILYENDCYASAIDYANLIVLMINGKIYLTKDGKREVWYKFIDKNENVMDGELYKWSKIEGETYFFDEFISGKFRHLYNLVKSKMEIELSANETKKNKSMITALKNTKKSLGTPGTISSIVRMMKHKLEHKHLVKLMDSYNNVIGVKNGILVYHFGENGNIRLEFIQGYSKYFVSKHANANYIPYDENNEYIKLWRKIFEEIFVDEDVRQYFWYKSSTGMDQFAKDMKVLELIGFGSNGKSVVVDNILYVYNDDAYSVKLHSNLLIGRPKAGSADEDLMEMKNRNIGFITETNENDILVAARLKELTEYKKKGRSLYSGNESFTAFVTLIVASNFPLQIADNDYGTNRRYLITDMKVKFTENPDPNNPYEKEANRGYEHLAINNPDAADALFSILVYERCKLHELYNSNIDLVPIPTIRKETSEFQQTQNRMTSFMARKIVNLYGYNTKGQNYVKLDEIIKYYEENNIIFAESINFTNIVESFRIWLKKYHGQDLNFTYAERKLIQCTNLQKLLKDGKLFGYRILSDDEKKLDKENNYIN